MMPIVFQLCEFLNDNLLGAKIDFEFLSENSPCSINDLEHLSKISLFICSAQTFPRIFWTIICLVRICQDDSFDVTSHCKLYNKLMSLYTTGLYKIQDSPVLLQRFPLLFTSHLKHHSSYIIRKVLCLRLGSDAVLYISRIKFEFRRTQINLDRWIDSNADLYSSQTEFNRGQKCISISDDW